MKAAFILSIIFSAACGLLALTAPTPARADTCDQIQWNACYRLCDEYAPGSCYVTYVSCYSGTCGCDLICSIGSHDTGNNIKHMAIVLSEW